jgi:uncharacterized protein (TIGR03790 family)
MTVLLLVLIGLFTLPAAAGPAMKASEPDMPKAVGSAWMAVPRVLGRLTSRDIGLLINTADPYSEAVGQHYIERRGLSPDQVLRVELPLRPRLTPEEFERLRRRVDEHFGSRVQALAVAWRQPYAVDCNSITGALALGYDAELCQNTCGRSRSTGYFNSRSSHPFHDHGIRLSMLLAARDVADAKALIDRGVAADRIWATPPSPPVNAFFLATSDAARSVRSRVFPPSGLMPAHGVAVKVEQGDVPSAPRKVLMYLTGLAQVPQLDTVDWVPGALADHLTSFGGQLDRVEGQMTALAWIAAGATASHGPVREPCNHLQKFPHPQVLLLQYVQGVTAVEAYWKSVAWPQQGLFIGEPLAAPFAR